MGQRTALAGLIIYAALAPHSVAASTIAVGLAGFGWLIRTLAARTVGLRRSRFDLIILLSILWTVASSLLSVEPKLSLAKLTALWCVFLFYLTRAVVTKQTALLIVAVLILSGAVGTLYSAFDLVRGRGVVVESMTQTSPFRGLEILTGDTIWRVDKTRIYSTTDLNDVVRGAPKNTPITVSVISRGEHVERTGLILPATLSDAGVIGNTSSHRFRASGFTSHYGTYAELLQMIAQLALGLALANFRNHGANKYFRVALIAACVLATGIALTAMRTLVVSFAIGAAVIAWRSLQGKAKVVFTFVLFLVIGFGAVIVWQTRAANALSLNDHSSSLRVQVAQVGLSRIRQHPVFGHGMEAMKLHWNEWGFPGKDMLHLHSTPLQLAFDRGIPMLLLWLWLMGAFWLHISRASRRASERSDTNSYGILLGVLGALTGFLVSSVVNYNYGDSEAVMMFWFLMGVALVLSSEEESAETVAQLLQVQVGKGGKLRQES
jgi:O-antigen ligase